MKFWQEVDGLLLRQAAKQSDAVRAAIVRSVPVEDIVNRWAEAHPTEGTIMPADARAWAQMNAIIPVKPLADVLDHVHAVGWVLGDDASTAAFGRAAQGIDKAAPSDKTLKVAIETNWDKWKPGNKPASLLVRPPGAFAALLEQGRASVKGINATIADRIGTVLADSLNSGDTYTTLSKKFLADTITSKVVKNPLHAEMIAVTEMSRAFNASTVNNYTEFGVELVEWLAIDVGTCPICPANAAQGPIPLGQPFQSGEIAPPAHPHCRCTLIPVVDEGTPAASAGLEEDFSTDEMEISNVADHGLEDIFAQQVETPVTDLPQLTDIFVGEGGEDAKDAIQGIYGDREYNGFTVNVRTASSYVDTDGSKVINFSANIYPPQDLGVDRAGQVQRTFTEKPDGTRVVHHDLLSLSAEYRGQGFSTAFSKFSEDYYRANGIDEIEISAALEDGSYTWAKAGYTWAEWKPNKIMLRLENIINRDVDIPGVAPEVADEVIGRLERMLDTMTALHMSNERFPQPIELARFKGPDVEGVPFGRWLLHNTQWLGKKVL